MNNKTYSCKGKIKNNNNIDEDNKIITQLQKSKITSLRAVPQTTTTTNSNVLRSKSLTTTINSRQLDLLINKTIPNCNGNSYMKTYSKLSLFSRNFNHSKTFSNTDAYTSSELNDVILKNDIKIKQSIDHINNYLNNHKRKCNSSSNRYVDKSRSLSPHRNSNSRHFDSSNSLSPHRNSSSRNGYTNSYMNKYITNNNNKTTGATTVTPSAVLSTRTIIPTTTTTYNTKNVSTTTVIESNIGVEKKKKSEKKKSNHSIDKVVLCLDELDLDMEYNKIVGTDKHKRSNNNHHPHHNHKIDIPHKFNSGSRVSNKDNLGKDTHDKYQHNNINHMFYKHKTSTSTQSINSFDTTKAEIRANKIYNHNHQKNHQIVMNVESDPCPLVTHTTLDIKDIHVVDSRVINIPTLIHKESDNNSFKVLNSVVKQSDDDHGHENDDYHGDDQNDMKYDPYLDTKQNIRTGHDIYSQMIHDGDYNIVSNQYYHPENQIDDVNGIYNDLVISGDDYVKHFDHQYATTTMNINDDDINEMKVNSNIHMDEKNLKVGRTNSKYDIRHDDEMDAYLDVIELAPVSILHYHPHHLLSSRNDTYHVVEKCKKQHCSYRSSDALLQTVSNDLLLLSLIERCNQRSYLLINQEVLKASTRLLVTDDVLTRTERCGQRLHQLVDAVTITIVKKLVSYYISS
jgi:hypothetical protein